MADQIWEKGFVEALPEDKRESMLERAPSAALQQSYLGIGDFLAGVGKKKDDRQLELFAPAVIVSDCQGNGVLHYAAEGGQADLAKKIAKAMPEELERANQSGRTPLHMAVLSGNARAVEALAGAGAKADAQDHDGSTPLHLAAWLGDKEMLEILAKQKANLNAKDKEGMTALMMAVLSGSKDAIAYLAQSGADLDEIDTRKRSAMHYANQTGQSDLADLLEKAGSMYSDQDASGKTPDDYRSDWEQGLKTVEAMARHGAEKRRKRLS